MTLKTDSVYLGLLGAAGGLLLLASAARAQSQVGSVSELSGSATYQRRGANANVVASMPVDLLDQYTTESAASLTITLNDKSQLDLAESSSLAINQQTVGGGTTTQVSLLGGRVDSVVTAAIRATGPSYVVQTPNAIAGVRGTKFSVTYQAQSPVCGNQASTDIAVAQGTVLGANRRTPSVTVQVDGGYETVICGNRPPLPPGPLGLAGMTGPGGVTGGYAGGAPGVAGAPPPACPVCPACQTH